MVERYDSSVPISMVGSAMSGLLTQHEDPQLIYLLNDGGTNRHLVRDAGLQWRYTRETASIRVGDSSASLDAVGYGELRGYVLDRDGEEVYYTFPKV